MFVRPQRLGALVDDERHRARPIIIGETTPRGTPSTALLFEAANLGVRQTGYIPLTPADGVGEMAPHGS